MLNSLSVFFPCYNDSKTIGKLVKEAFDILPKFTSDFEVVVIEDGSKDESLKVLEKLKKSFPELKIIIHKVNLGYGRTLIDGFKNSNKEWVFYTDGDGQYDITELNLLIDELETGIDVVNGYKLSRSDSFLRRYIGSFYSNITKKVYKLPIRDIDCDFRLIRRKLIEPEKLKSVSGGICFELITSLNKKGAKFKEVGVHHYPRKYGKSQFFKFKHLINTILDWKKLLSKPY